MFEAIVKQSCINCNFLHTHVCNTDKLTYILSRTVSLSSLILVEVAVVVAASAGTVQKMHSIITVLLVVITHISYLCRYVQIPSVAVPPCGITFIEVAAVVVSDGTVEKYCAVSFAYIS